MNFSKYIFSIFIISKIFFSNSLVFANEVHTDKNLLNNISNKQEIFQENISNFTTSSLIVDRISHSGWVVFLVLIILILLSILSWAIIFSKYIHLKKIQKDSASFLDKFWETESLNILYDSLEKYPNSPVKEVFKKGYSELLKTNHIQSRELSLESKSRVVLSNLGRSLYKTKFEQKKKLESFLSFLAITASSAPFIGLFGTVWGIMNAFESIAISGSSSLASVAPGISEALIATAFGLAAAIPAVIGFNMSNVIIKALVLKLDSFIDEFLNIVERYIVINNSKSEKQ